MDEMICLWEGLLPESPPFALHQLRNLVDEILSNGSITKVEAKERSRSRTAEECQECGSLCQKAEYSQVQGAVIISIRDQQTFGSRDTLSKPVPDQTQLGKTRYTPDNDESI